MYVRTTHETLRHYAHVRKSFYFLYLLIYSFIHSCICAFTYYNMPDITHRVGRASLVMRAQVGAFGLLRLLHWETWFPSLSQEERYFGGL